MADQSSTSLKRLKDTFKTKNGVIVPAVQRHLLKKADGPQSRDTDHIHPSEVAKSDWCARRAWLRITGAESNAKKESASSKMEMVFQEGHDIHSKWQRWIAQSEGLALVGKWQCRNCDEVWFGSNVDGSCCDCGMCDPVYREVPFNVVNAGYHVIGHADGMVNVDGRTVLIEIKSIGMGTLRFEAPRLFDEYTKGKSVADVWMDIKSPFPSHIRQGMLYLWLARQQYDPDINEIIFIYEYKPTQDVKEFSVKYNEKLIEERIGDIVDITDSLETGEDVPRPEWAEHSDGPVCASCEYRESCWGIEPDKEPSSENNVRRTVKKSTAARKRGRVRPSK